MKPQASKVVVELAIVIMKHLARGDARAVYRTALNRRMEFSAFAAFVAREEMGPWLYATARELGILPVFPRRFIDDVARAYTGQHARNDDQLKVMTEIAQVLGEASIDFMLLKGHHVAEQFWGGIDRRFVADVDILVRPENAGDALSVLGHAGFSRPVGALAPHWAARYAHHAVARRRRGTSVDVHWTLRTKPGMRLDMEKVWRDRQLLAIGGAEYSVLSDAHLLLAMILGVAIDTERGLCRLRKLWDLYLVVNHLGSFDWACYFAERKNEGLLPIVINVLALALWRLDCREEFPTLVAAIERHRGLLRVSTRDEAVRVLDGSPWNPRNHLWFAMLQPAPVWYYGLWWAATLPLRFIAARDA